MDENPVVPEEEIPVDPVPPEIPEGWVPTGEIDPVTGEPIYETEPPAPPVPQTASQYLKISRAIGGDSMWMIRLETALEISGLENTRANILAVTKAVAEFIDCDVEGAVSTERVTDEMIDTAIGAIPSA